MTIKRTRSLGTELSRDFTERGVHRAAERIAEFLASYLNLEFFRQISDTLVELLATVRTDDRDQLTLLVWIIAVGRRHIEGSQDVHDVVRSLTLHERNKFDSLRGSRSARETRKCEELPAATDS